MHLPAEWEPHEATWIAWPHNADDWPGKFETIPWVFGEIVKRLSMVERVCILVNEQTAESARQVMESVGSQGRQVEYHTVPTDRVWTRDYAPFFVRGNGGLQAVKWRFNAWAKYDNWQLDQEAGLRIAELSGLPCEQPTWNGRAVVLEGGSIDVNGRGTLLTSEECLLSTTQQRNPGLGKSDYERLFAEHLGIRKTIWLHRGIAGDDTHGHIDDLARFINPTTVVTVVEDERGDVNYEPLRENLELLQNATDQMGKPLDVVKLPMPQPVHFNGQRLPASYANFYIANSLVLVPTFNDEHDRQALNTLAAVFPDRQVIGIYCGDLVWGLGTIHCMTMQQPSVA
jgi:agmatine deiminase